MVVIVQDDTDVQEEEHVAYLRLLEDPKLVNPVLKAMCKVPLESITIDILLWKLPPVVMSVVTQDPLASVAYLSVLPDVLA